MRRRLCIASAAVILFSASPALAQEDYSAPDYDAQDYDNGAPDNYRDYNDDARQVWLQDCRERVAQRDNGVGGALIGGAVGGLAGNRIAGRGNRAVGTIAGAAVGAVTGAAIDQAEDRGQDRDECEAYLDDYYARYYGSGAQAGYDGYRPYPPQGYYPAYGYGSAYPYGYAGPSVTPAEPQCTETVEYVYEDVPVRPARRVIQRRATDKRVRIVPDKRVPLN